MNENGDIKYFSYCAAGSSTVAFVVVADVAVALEFDDADLPFAPFEGTTCEVGPEAVEAETFDDKDAPFVVP